MIITELRFSQIQVKLPTKKVMRLLGETEREDLEIQIEFLIGHSFDSTERKLMGRNKDQKGVIFQKQINLLSQKQEDTVKIELLWLSEQFKVYTKQVSLKKIIQNANQRLIFEVDQQQQQIQITYKLTHHLKTMSKRLIIKNPKIQLLKIRMQRDSYLLQMKLMKIIQRTLIQTNTTFWQDSLKFQFNDQQSKLKMQIFLVDSKKNINKLYQLKVQIFKRKAGSKKIMICNQNNFPIGCFQFDYQTEGFSNIEKELIPEKYTTEIYKIHIGKLKGKFKSPTSQVRNIKVVSNIALIDIEKISVTENSFQYDLQKYIYSETPNCMLIMTFIQENVEVYGFVGLELKMLGKFQKRMPIINSQTKAIMGHLFINIQATKRHAKNLKLTSICLKLDSFNKEQRGMQVIVSASISCCFGKTQHRQLSDLVTFLKGLQLKYSKGQILNLNIIETKTHSKIIIPIKLQQLQNKISGQYEQNFGKQHDFARGTISFSYSYDDNGKDSLAQKCQPDSPIVNNNIETPKNETSQLKKIDKSAQKMDIKNEKQVKEKERSAQVLIKQHKKQIQLLQRIKPNLQGEKAIQVIKKTPKQTLLQCLTNHNLQNNPIQQLRPPKKMKINKKKVTGSAQAKDPHHHLFQGLPANKSPNKIDSLKRYEYIKNIYLKNFNSSNANSLHKKSYLGKLSELSCKKQKEVYKQPQLPLIANKRLKQGQRNFFAVGNELTTRITANKFRKN